MSRDRRQGLILAAGWIAVCILALEGLEPRKGLILVAASAVVFAGLHFVLLWSNEPDHDADATAYSVTSPESAGSTARRHLDTPKGRLTEKRLSHLAELADVGLVQASVDGEIEFASRRARELLDLDTTLAKSEAWSQAFESLRAHFLPDSTSTGAVQILTTGGPRLLSLKAHPVSEEDWSGYLVQVRDRKLLEALESDLRFASRLRVLNHLYLGVAHDLKGPLNAIMLTLEGLRADIEEGVGDDAHHLERLDVIREELARHHRSLETVLAQTAPEKLERQRFDLRLVVDHVAKLIRPQLRHQKIELETIGEEPAPVTAIQDRIREVLLAISVNAMEAMPAGGKLTIHTSSGLGVCSIDVRDTGSGIPDEILHQIFDLRFTTKDTGTGIGLSTARSIVESENGTVELIETGDAGSTFRISLPSAETE